MKFCLSTVSGHGRTDQLLSPIRIIVRMPKPENRKVDDLSKSFKQAPHSKQAIGHVMHCRRYCLLHVVVQGPGSFADRPTFLYDVRLRSYGASKLPNYRILAYFPIQNQPTAYGLHRRMITIFAYGSQKRAMVSIDDL